ncbi:hypothetical protein [Streptomyces johnsoniae]|uniref:Uncharacterized protein n=1 Tax=Streptomyces johnsoniae TaxID=3075532 RepID=A0ABU2SDB6_9ACTN|nr:hypothetical protein [Streptomyces sp. DSM 41886]MDT0446793.1 hypothetical protein [Streptomyces sp. DSM 41886]
MDTTLVAAEPLTLDGFSPVITVEPATETTLGREQHRDADKADYWEGTRP